MNAFEQTPYAFIEHAARPKHMTTITITRLPKIICKQAALPPVLADPVIAAMHNHSTGALMWATVKMLTLEMLHLL